jgi:EmrB/QacA subfamily drug resistance transporter
MGAGLLRLDERTRPWWTLVGSCLGLFVLMLDSTVVALALPSIEQDLGASRAEVQWVLNGYLLVIAALVVSAGRLGDIFGRRAVFTAGLAIFLGGSVLAGAAWSPEAVITGRLVQGVGAASMLPLSLALVSDAFPLSRRPQAIGIWTAISSLALGIGPLIGGFLVDADWRLIFWVNVPLCALGVAVVLAVVRESRDESAGRRLDIPGLVLISAALTAIVLPLAESQQWGFDSPATIGLLAAGVLGLLAFHAVEGRVRQPIVDFELFRNGPYFGATAAAFALVGAYWALMLLQPQYLQTVLGHSATAAGILILPITVPMIAISPFADRLIARFGARGLMSVGMLCGTVGVALQTRVDASSGYGTLLPGFLLFGIALGLVYAPMSNAAMAAMPAEKAGLASGVLAMTRVLSGALSVAICGAIFQSLEASASGGAAARFTDGLSGAIWFLVGLLAVGTVLTWTFVRSAPASRAPAPKPSAVAELATEPHHLHHRRFHL